MNPYEVLGIDNNASQDEIKEKYRVLLEEYTMNQDETTEEKIQKLNDAYDMLVNGNLYREIRGLIERKNFAAAEARLNIANDRDNGEWNYLQGFVCVQKGWFETGLNYLRKAVELDPENTEYLSSLNTLHARVIEYATKYANMKSVPRQVPGNNNNNMNACGGNGGGNGGMC